MANSKVAIIVPEGSGTAGLRKLSRQLTNNGVRSLGHNKLVHAVERSEALYEAFAAGKLSATDLWTDVVPTRKVRALPQNLQRGALAWNDLVKQGSRGLERSAINRTLKAAKLELRGERVYDLVGKKEVGKPTTRIRGEKSVGNWTLNQIWNWFPIPIVDWLGIYWGHYAVVNLTSKASVACQLIRAEITGPHHGALSIAFNSRQVAASSNGFIPFWEVTNRVSLKSTAYYGGQSKTVRTNLTV